MTSQVTCRYSTIASTELMARVIPDYCIEPVIECLFWERGANDTYNIRCADAHYFLRVYRHGAFPREAIEFEVAALNYLHQQGIPVAIPIARKSGGYLTEVIAPEGSRYILVSSLAKGCRPDYDSLDNCHLVGQSLAQLHLSSMGFSTSYKRTQLDLQGLLENPLKVIRQHMAHRPDLLRTIETIAQEIRVAVEAVSGHDLTLGLCHGDLHGGNLHLHEGRVTHFDFEECAFGYQLYDLATFKWGVCLGSSERRIARWPAFLQGYESVLSLSKAERSLINKFVLIREISETAYGIRHINDFGHNGIMASDLDEVCTSLTELSTLTA